MKVKLHIDGKKYSSKPTDTGRINNAITQNTVEVSPLELSNYMISGQTALLATMDGERSNLNMIQQQVLMLDFDNTIFKKVDGKKVKCKAEGDLYTSLDDIMEHPYIQKNASFIYTTFSHKDYWDKFRVCFILKHPLTNYKSVTAAYEYLFNIFPTADASVKDAARIFYGGKQAFEVDYKNILDVTDEMIKIEPAADKLANKVMVPLDVPAPVIAAGERKTWELIKAGEKDKVKSRLGAYAVNVPSKTSAITVLKSLNMMDVLGEPTNIVYDFFHFEKKPSGSIFKMDDSNIWLYKCHSASKAKTMDLIQLVSKLLDVSYMESVNYLIEATGIKIVLTPSMILIREQADLFMGLLLSEDLKIIYPEIHGRFWRYKATIVSLLTIFKENIYEDENGDIRCLSWYSLDTLSKKVNMNRQTLNNLLNLMTETDWLKKLDDSQIPGELLKKLKISRHANKRSMRGNVYEMLLYQDSFFDTLNAACKVMKENGKTMRGMSYEYAVRTYGQAKANELYPQMKDKGITVTSDRMVKSIHEITLNLLEEKGFVHESDVIKKMNRKYKKAYREVIMKRCISEMLDMYSLKKISLTKALKAHFGLDTSTKGSPKVIVKSNLIV